MASFPALSRFVPRVRLSTVFLLIFCVAVGLAIHPNPLDALTPTIASAMCLGLIQQARQLFRAKRTNVDTDSHWSFAFKFAILWRLALASVIAACLVSQMSISHHLWQEPTSGDLIVYQSSIWTVVQICMIVVLSDSVRRWSPHTPPAASNRWRVVFWWILSLAVVAAALPDLGLVAGLVHLATEGIEAGQPVRFSRTGTYPNHQTEGFRSFWITSAALIIGFLAIIFFVLANAVQTRRRRLWSLVAFTISITAAGGFCVWYYAREFHRISPDLASVGPAGGWFDWFKAATIVVILISAVAYRFSCVPNARIVLSPNLNDRASEVALHEAGPTLVLLTALIACDIYVIVKAFVDFTPSPGMSNFWEFLALVITWRDIYLQSAIDLLILQLCWIHWRRRNETIAWQLAPVDGQRYFLNWAGIALLVLVSIPLFAAYSFVYWLGPWYLYGQ
jgi:hypothetical protein